jgi:hypothetical protein
MKNKILGILVGLVAMGMMASAATVSCLGVSDVTAGGLGLGGGNNCDVAPATSVFFSNFVVSASAGFTGSTVGISSLLTNVTAGEINLVFQIANAPVTATSGDVILTYEVTGGINGVDLQFQATPGTGGGGVKITEQACTTAFVGGSCPITSTTLANYFLTSTGATVTGSASFPLTQTVWIQKDITYTNAAMSQFENSQATPVPEPVTLSMVGLGLMGLGLMRRRQVGK